jgi:hypothetical protein
VIDAPPQKIPAGIMVPLLFPCSVNSGESRPLKTSGDKNEITEKVEPPYLDAKCRCHAMHINIMSS